MIRPVRIDDPDLRNRRIPFFFITEIGLHEFQIIKTHGQSHMSG